LDLGTASVKALVVEQRGKQTHIWGQSSVALEGGYGPDGQIADRQAVTAACEAALSMAEEMTLETFGHKLVPDRSAWSVPGWMCRVRLLPFKARRSDPGRRISRRERQTLRDRLERAVSQLPGEPVDVVPAMQVDGRAVTDAVGLQGRDLILSAVVVTSPPKALAVLRSVAEALELEPPLFVSQARALAAGLSDDGVILDVGRWGTAVAVADRGLLAAAAWVPMGAQSFYRTLMNGFGLLPAQLPGFCRALAAGELNQEVAVAADAALVDPVNRWVDRVADQLASLAVQDRLPHRVFLAGGASRLPALMAVARRYGWMNVARWSRHPEIHLWRARNVELLVNHTAHPWGISDLVRLGLARLADGLG
jgi:hypothetical protein